MPKLTKAEANVLSVFHTALGKILGIDQEEPKAKGKSKDKAPAETTDKPKGLAEARKPANTKRILKMLGKKSVSATAKELGYNYSAVKKIQEENDE